MKFRKLTAEKDFDAIVKLKDNNLEGAKNALRTMREDECFKYVDRAAWYDGLTPEEKQEAQTWRTEWKNITDTFVCPVKPNFIK